MLQIIVCVITQGKVIDDTYTGKPQDDTDIILSDDDEEDLDRVDTMLHFGGGKFDKANADERGAYGNSGGGGDDMGDAYRSRREELEDRIKMKKMEKAERMKKKEDQGELSTLSSYHYYYYLWSIVCHMCQFALLLVRYIANLNFLSPSIIVNIIVRPHHISFHPFFHSQSRNI